MMKSLIAFAIAIGLAVWLKYKLAIAGWYLLALAGVILFAYLSGTYDGEMSGMFKQACNRFKAEYERGRTQAT